MRSIRTVTALYITIFVGEPARG